MAVYEVKKLSGKSAMVFTNTDAIGWMWKYLEANGKYAFEFGSYITLYKKEDVITTKENGVEHYWMPWKAGHYKAVKGDQAVCEVTVLPFPSEQSEVTKNANAEE